MSAVVKEMNQDDPKFLPTQMGVTEHKLRVLRKEYDPSDIPATVKKGDDAYHQVHNKVMAITKVRTGIEKVRKALKADALEWGRKVDAEAKRLTEAVEALESPWREVKTQADERQAREEEEARLAEEARIAEIEGKVKAIRTLPEGLLNADSAMIESRWQEAKALSITEEEFDDYAEVASHARTQAMETLEQALTMRQQLEAQQAEQKRQAEAMAAQQAEIDRQQRELEERKAQADAESNAEREAQKEVEPQQEAKPDEPAKQDEPLMPAAHIPTHKPAAKTGFDAWWDLTGQHLEHMTREGIARAAWNANNDPF